MQQALFVNGVYPGVLEGILDAQNEGASMSFLQPHTGKIIRLLRETKPTAQSPLNLYISTTKDLTHITYTAKIIGWEDKNMLSTSRRRQVDAHLSEHQSGEVKLFRGQEKSGSKPINLLTITGLRMLETAFPTSVLIKASDNLPLSVNRTRSGGWSAVIDQPDLFALQIDTAEKQESEFNAAIRNSFNSSQEERNRRLARAPKMPSKVMTVSVTYRRNPDVIVTVLCRADGMCEECGRAAPFSRRKDGSPYLEVHHKILLSLGGEDTVENAIALCPNCHRKAHHG
jgi:5-methylcytosine-specific restriction protein A